MSKLNILVIGSGGREHALAHAVQQSTHAGKLYIAPGNAGTAELGENVPIAADEVVKLVAFVRENQIDLVIVGPEVPLALGIVDSLAEIGIRAFGPSGDAAQLEASKAYAKAFMEEFNIPTARYASFEDYESARDYLASQKAPIVVKADGLAAGKGVIVAQTTEQAQDALERMMLRDAFGKAGGRVVIEEVLTGLELSVMAFCDGKTAVLMPPARDHKRVFDNDEGENTGGMGAFTYPPDIDDALLERIRTTIMQPAVDGMAARGIPFVGVLYGGFILTEDGPKTLEFNVRFGDPETQVILPLLESDLLEVIEACLNGTLAETDVRWKSGTCATVVAASAGYPGAYSKNIAITGTHDVENAMVFHAGTAHKDGKLVTSGGRVLSVSAVGDNIDEAIQQVYQELKKIHFDGMHYRTDIGKSAAVS